MKTKIKSYDDENIDFYDKEILTVDSNHTCLSVICFDSALKKDENYYLQMCYCICLQCIKIQKAIH